MPALFPAGVVRELGGGHLPWGQRAAAERRGPWGRTSFPVLAGPLTRLLCEVGRVRSPLWPQFPYLQHKRWDNRKEPRGSLEGKEKIQFRPVFGQVKEHHAGSWGSQLHGCLGLHRAPPSQGLGCLICKGEGVNHSCSDMAEGLRHQMGIRGMRGVWAGRL